MNGIDISNYQSAINLTVVKPEFVIAKISEGTTFRDGSFDRFYNDCKNLDIPAGAYVYSHSTSAERGRAEAEYALSLLHGRPLDLPIYLDIEGDILSAGKTALTASALAFAQNVRSKGYKAGVYASLSAFRSSLDLDALRANGISIWCAQWGVSEPSIECDIWQRAVGRVNGYAADIDLDVMFKQDIQNDVQQDIQQKLYPADMAVLCKGFYGSQTEILQKCLSIPVTGVFDQLTEYAVKDYQSAHGLTSDGIVGRKTWEVIVK